MNFEVKENNKKIFKELVESASEKALEECGLLAEKYASDKAPKKTTWLAQNISHKVVSDGNKHNMYVGTNVEYAVYNEFGTGQYYAGGRKTSWCYQDKEGKWHRTNGMQARPFIKPAIADHIDKYRNILISNLKGK